MKDNLHFNRGEIIPRSQVHTENRTIQVNISPEKLVILYQQNQLMREALEKIINAKTFTPEPHTRPTVCYALHTVGVAMETLKKVKELEK